jgi:hypothetical protein
VDFRNFVKNRKKKSEASIIPVNLRPAPPYVYWKKFLVKKDIQIIPAAVWKTGTLWCIFLSWVLQHARCLGLKTTFSNPHTITNVFSKSSYESA